MNKNVLNKCSSTAQKIVNIIEGMGFTTQKRLAEGELNALIIVEVRNLLNDVVTDFYRNAALVEVEPDVVDVAGEPIFPENNPLEDVKINFNN